MIEQLIDYLNKLPPQVAGSFMACFIAVLRVVGDEKETTMMRIFLESLLCGALSLIAGSAVQAMGLNTNWILFMGGCIGYFGSATIKSFALRIITDKVDKL